MVIPPNYRGSMTAYSAWTPQDAAANIAVPSASDDKYTRGVLGMITGSVRYPGAAVLGVEAALRTGVGMVRYLGPRRAETLVLQRRPEAVTGNGRVQAWLVGSGIDHPGAADDAGADRVAHPDDGVDSSRELMVHAVSQGVPVVLDGGGLDLYARATGPTVITPHFGELARVLDTAVGEITANPGDAAARAADRLGVTVLLKGSTTFVASPGGTRLSAASAPPWLATAGSGEALGGILGALVATRASEIERDPEVLARLAATASVIHGLAAARASAGGPLTILDLAAALPATIAELLGL